MNIFPFSTSFQSVLSQNLSLSLFFHSLPALYLHDMNIPPLPPPTATDAVVIAVGARREIYLLRFLPCLWFPMVPSYRGEVISGG